MSPMVPRFIPVLLMQETRLVKGRRFRKHRYVGDPLNTARLFNAKKVDELALLDISARSLRRAVDLQLLAAVSDECSFPLTFGGGVGTIGAVRDIIRCGVEKVLLCTAALESPRLIEEAADEFGSQAVAVAMEYVDDRRGRVTVTSNNGRVRHTVDPIAHVEEVVRRGAGEIYLFSVTRDGTRRGFDGSMIRMIASAVDVPVVPSGGAGTVTHLEEATAMGAAGAAAGTLFVMDESLGSPLVSYPRSGRMFVTDRRTGD